MKFLDKNATIKDVAREAGVSLATVSRVINHENNVSPGLQAKVWDTVERLGYSPNSAARSLIKRKTGCIGIIVHNLHDPFFHELIRGFEIGASRTQYSVMFCSVFGGDLQSKEKYLKYLTNGVVDAVILYGSYLSDEAVIQYLQEKSSMNYVLIENDMPEIDCNKLLIDNQVGAKEAVDYLIKKGHRKIACLCANPNKKVSLDRFNGYMQAMHESNLEVCDGYIQYATVDYSSGYQRLKMLMELPVPPTAVFCGDDAIASYAIRAALDMGLRVPEDLSIMGFDNQAILPDRYRGPDITSVAQPLEQIGIDSVLLLSEQLSGKLPDKSVIKTYSTSIVEKETVAEYHDR
ncbi:LacI family DNA-binding transcriptional regulator [Hydrogenoanaerobacterium sp.]|uniref:LacI family DNA-binding transcriptional regulator n=1 Tax=Hydrogenoanaerobacterium sp. TaxID=2953763 RepID=UPI0028A2295D|nr:LacI family DNA-binding transcriptional regulator [Hydrogenoanaerobacterium sp.]